MVVVGTRVLFADTLLCAISMPKKRKQKFTMDFWRREKEHLIDVSSVLRDEHREWMREQVSKRDVMEKEDTVHRMAI